jgi:hypothetical protein
LLTLLEKLYGAREADARQAFTEFLGSFSSGLDAEIKFIGKNERGWIQVQVSGSDSSIATSYLRKKLGIAQPLTELRLPVVLKGKIVDSGKIGYGLYIDLGFSETNPVDALIPLHKLRSHFADGKKLSAREIIDLFCFKDNFPLSIRLIKVDVESKKIWAEPSDEQVELFRDWFSTKADRVISFGAHKELLTAAIRKSGIDHYIAGITELGFLECAINCRSGTDAPGIIKVLGKYLGGVQLCAFSPRRINAVLDGHPS